MYLNTQYIKKKIIWKQFRKLFLKLFDTISWYVLLLFIIFKDKYDIKICRIYYKNCA